MPDTSPSTIDMSRAVTTNHAQICVDLMYDATHVNTIHLQASSEGSLSHRPLSLNKPIKASVSGGITRASRVSSFCTYY